MPGDEQKRVQVVDADGPGWRRCAEDRELVALDVESMMWGQPVRCYYPALVADLFEQRECLVDVARLVSLLNLKQ